MNTQHILLIDPLDRLVIKKDSSLMLALTLQEMGEEVWLLFKENLYFSNSKSVALTLHSFSGSFFDHKKCYLDSFTLTESTTITLTDRSLIHMRLDPPFDTNYLRTLWILEALERHQTIKVLNTPKSILTNNEKLTAYRDSSAIPGLISSDKSSLLPFLAELRATGAKSIIIKPLDLYQGIGVSRHDLSLSDHQLTKRFEEITAQFNGPVVIQPFVESVVKGELRSTYFAGIELGTIKKIPPKGEFLANIAQGATYHAVELSAKERAACDKIAQEMNNEGAPWVAFDILGEKISEVNITCPGLLVEVSNAVGRNLAQDIVEKLSDQ
jgi:glutathione synthase